MVGRVDADLTIDDPLISRRHASIRPLSGGLEIEDLGSLNGTWVNGERIDGRRVLASGDVVQVGAASFEIAVEPSGPARTVIAPALGRDVPGDAARLARPRSEQPGPASRPTTSSGP